MKNTDPKRVRVRLIVLVASLLVSVSALAQTKETDRSHFQLGEKVVVIPAPEGFEEAASQFESIKTRMTATEDPRNDMLAVHVPTGDCDKLRRGESGPLNFYTKVSILKVARTRNLSETEFAALRSELQQNGAALLDIKSPRLKASIEHAEKAVRELSENKIQIEVGQPENLGEFDNRPNVYSIMLLTNFTVQSGDHQQVVPLLGGISFIRVKQRLLYVYTYRRYESKADIEILRDFAKQWVTSILAAN